MIACKKHVICTEYPQKNWKFRVTWPECLTSGIPNFHCILCNALYTVLHIVIKIYISWHLTEIDINCIWPNIVNEGKKNALLNCLVKKTPPVLTEKLTLDRANTIFVWNYISFIILLYNYSHPQPKKGRFTLDKNLAAQNIETSRFRCLTKIYIYYSTLSFAQK